jgi:hypothetical protein
LGAAIRGKMGAAMRRAILVAVGLSCLTVGGAKADFVSGNELWNACQETDPVKSIFCISYILGAAETFRVLQLTETIQPLHYVPPKVENGQVIDVVKVFLRDHPEKRQYSSPTLIMLALRGKFPCD